jgi:Integrase
LAATTGVRRSELLGLRWNDVDLHPGTLWVNRGLDAVAYELHESRGKTANSRRRIDLDPTTVAVLRGWQSWQQAEHAARPPARHLPSLQANRPARRHPGHPTARSSPHPRHLALLLRAGVPVKVVSERLGHANPAFTIDTYQHVLPGTQANAARLFEQLVAPTVLPGGASTVSARLKRREKSA